HPVMVLLPVTQYAENVILFAAALMFAQFGLAVRTPTAARWLLAGALFGLLTLVKPSAIALLPGLGVGAARAVSRARVKALLLFTLALAGARAACVVRSGRTPPRWFLVTTGGGRQFWLGNNPDATGATNENPTPPAWLVDTLYTHPEREREGIYYREGWRFVRANPGRALGLYFTKIGS